MDTVYNVWQTTNDLIGGDSDGPGLGIAKYLGGSTHNKNRKMSIDQLGAGFDGGDEQSQFNAQRFDNWNATQIRVRDALKAGINPLAALGVSSNVSPTFHGGGYSSRNKFAGLSNFMASMSRIFNKQEQESRELDLEAKRIRNRIAQEELNHLRSPGTPIGNESMEVPPIGTDSLLFRFTYDIEGRPRLMVNQDVTENDADNAGYRSSLAAALASGQINPVTGRVSSPQLRMKLADDYYRATGRHLTNEEEMYISPTELGLVALDEIRGRN